MIDFIGFNNSKQKVRFYVREKGEVLGDLIKQLDIVNNLYSSKNKIGDKIIEVEANSNTVKLNNSKYMELLEATESGYKENQAENIKAFEELGENIK